MVETELAWLAGWLEGEGSFIVTSGVVRGKRYPRIRVNAVSTDADVLEHVQKMAGGVINGPYPRSGGGGKDVYVWSLSTARKALPLMREIEPLMVSARRQTQVRTAIEAAERYLND